MFADHPGRKAMGAGFLALLLAAGMARIDPGAEGVRTASAHGESDRMTSDVRVSAPSDGNRRADGAATLGAAAAGEALYPAWVAPHPSCAPDFISGIQRGLCPPRGNPERFARRER
jgi:hypothetical protein